MATGEGVISESEGGKSAKLLARYAPVVFLVALAVIYLRPDGGPNPQIPNALVTANPNRVTVKNGDSSAWPAGTVLALVVSGSIEFEYKHEQPITPGGSIQIPTRNFLRFGEHFNPSTSSFSQITVYVPGHEPNRMQVTGVPLVR